MPTLDFVQSCIYQSPKKSKSNYIFFSFGLEVESNISQFSVFKDLLGVENATRDYLLSLDLKNQIININRDSNDSYYNFVLNTFSIPNEQSIDCFIFKKWNDSFSRYDDSYWFNFDDFPNKNKGFLELGNSGYESFLKRFFKGRSWFANNYITGEHDFYTLFVYTTNYGTNECSGFRVNSSSFMSNNRGCLNLPIGVNYNITNFENPEDEFSYQRNFGDTHSLTSIMYYLTLDYFSNGVCCLAECFGITE